MDSNLEIWTPVQGYEKLYEISTFGNIKALPKEVISNGVIRSRQEKILRPIIRSGYKAVVLCFNKSRKAIPVHRLVAIHFIPNPESKPEVNHIDGDKKNNCVGNLEWCTRIENMRHAFKNKLNRGRIGTENAKAKITEHEVIEIRRLSACGKNGDEIAAIFNLCASTVNRIISRKYWKHVASI